MLPVDDVSAEDHSGADEEDVVGRGGAEPAQSRWDHRRRVAAEDPLRVDVAGVALVAGDRVRGEEEMVVVVADRHDPGTPAPTDLAGPDARESLDGAIDQ